jgi:phage terminase large subunit GpA-like protein
MILTAQTPGKRKSYSGPALSAILGDHAGKARALLAAGPHRYAHSAAERQVLRRRKKELPSVWAPKNFKVPYGPFESRYFSFEITPHLFGMLDAYAQPYVNKVTVCAAPQTTKTTFAHVATAWSSVFSPGLALHIYPTETTGKEIMDERIQRVYTESPQLRRLLTGRVEDVTQLKLRLKSMVIRMAWAGSLTQLAHRSAKIIVLDEVDKYGERPSETETTTVSQAKLRGRTFERSGGKILVLSSPSIESGNVWTELTKETQAVFVYWSRCPYCQTNQLMDFSKDTFIWPHGDDGHSLPRLEIAAKKLARYVCIEPSCRRQWDDDIRHKAQVLAMRSGWRLRMADGSQGEEMSRYMRRERPQSIGFIVPSWISYFVSLSQVAADYLKCKDKNLSPEEQFAAYQNFQNAHRSLPWKIEMQAQPVDKIKLFCDDRPEGRLPGGERVASLLAGIDTQDDNLFYLSLWAIGYGFANEQWLVMRRPLDSFAAIAHALWQSDYYDADGQRYHVEHALIDMLGHRTKEVLEFCIQYEGLITPCYGSARQMSQGYVFSTKEYLPGTDKPMPNGGIRAIRMNTKFYKDNMAIKLSLAPETPGCIHLFREAGDDYCKQLVSEARDAKGNWVQIGSRENHYWDNWCAVSCLADWLGIKHREKPDSKAIQEEDDSIIEGVMVADMGR